MVEREIIEEDDKMKVREREATHKDGGPHSGRRAEVIKKYPNLLYRCKIAKTYQELIYATIHIIQFLKVPNYCIVQYYPNTSTQIFYPKFLS